VTQRIPLTAAATLVAAFLFLLFPLPRRAIVLPEAGSQSVTVAGAFHVHSNRSDGSGSPDDVAAAAARAGLQFIVLTDHGDGTRTPDPPAYRSGVLVIDAVELSSGGGHYIAIGLPETPYPLRGEPRDVIEDVRRLGGFGIVAHPDSTKPGLQWRDWNAAFDGLEWLNADSEWRDESRTELLRALARYPLRRVETLASLLDRPDRALERWDMLTQQRRVVALAGADAHARAGWMDDDANGYRREWFLRIPSYEASFRTFRIHVAMHRPIGNDAGADAADIIAALKAGRIFTAIDAIATPAALDFTATYGEAMAIARVGDIIDPLARPITFRARSNATAGVIVLRKDGRVLTHQSVPELNFAASAGSGVYRVEIVLDQSPGTPPVPWVVSNPIYLQPPGWGTATIPGYPPASDRSDIQGGPWHVEKDSGSTGQVSQDLRESGGVEFSYQLAAGNRVGQYAALGISVGNSLTSRTRLAFHAQASQPMRLSVQARRPRSGERWQRSVYLDTTARELVVPFNEMTAVGTTPSPFDPQMVDTLLFVVDLTNAHPGASGTVTIRDLRVER
jgi:hypothetical protein